MSFCIIKTVTATHQFKLVRAILVEKSYRHAHDAVVVTGYGVGGGHFDSVVVVVALKARVFYFWVKLFAVGVSHKFKRLMPPPVFDIGQPQALIGCYDTVAVFVDASLRAVEFVTVGNEKARNSSAHAVAEPNLVVLNQREDFFVSDAVDVADDEELLLGVENLLEEVAEEAEGRVGDDDVGLVAEAFDFGGTKIAVAFEVSPFFERVEFVADVGEVGGFERINPAVIKILGGVELRQVVVVEEVAHGLADELFPLRGVTCRDEFLQAVKSEVRREKLGEVAVFGGVAGQQDGLAARKVVVVFVIAIEFALDVAVLGIEFVILVARGGVEVFISRHSVASLKSCVGVAGELNGQR